MARVLVVDDERGIRNAFAIALEHVGHSVNTAEDAHIASELLERDEVDVVVTDIVLPEMNGISLLESISSRWPQIKVILITGEPSLETATSAVRAGAHDYLSKPVTSVTLRKAVADAAKVKALEDDNRRLEQENLRRNQDLEEANARLRAEIKQRADAELELRNAQSRLVDTSRRAGMAEVAENVLHNVGNVLNSINVGLDVVREIHEASRTRNLTEVSDMVGQHADDLGAFFGTSERGKSLGQFLIALGPVSGNERDSMQRELALLTSKLRHIAAIIDQQREHAGAVGVTERVRLTDVMNNAFQLCGLDPNEGRIGVDVDIDGAIVLTLERHRLLQVLVNLLGNAVDAIIESGSDSGQLTLRASAEHGEIAIDVVDNGMGIEPETLPRIFEHGFSTKTGGSGYGLHSSALLAVEMGGRLTAESEGPGKGARFRLTLPWRED